MVPEFHRHRMPWCCKPRVPRSIEHSELAQQLFQASRGCGASQILRVNDDLGQIQPLKPKFIAVTRDEDRGK